MPYPTNKDLPDNIKVLPGEAQTIYRKTFNASFDEYGEERSRKIAWSL
jgi:cation transport regulator ChaB